MTLGVRCAVITGNTEPQSRIQDSLPLDLNAVRARHKGIARSQNVARPLKHAQVQTVVASVALATSIPNERTP